MEIDLPFGRLHLPNPIKTPEGKWYWYGIVPKGTVDMVINELEKWFYGRRVQCLKRKLMTDDWMELEFEWE